MSPREALVRRGLAAARGRTLGFAALFGAAAALQGTTYRSTYPTLADRLELARSFGANRALRLLYGAPHELLTVGGWLAWRLGALTVLAALWGLFAAARGLRGEEEAGRSELVLAGVAGRGAAFGAAIVALALQAAVLWLALWLGILAGRVDAAGAAYLALALVGPGVVFAAVGTLASQLAPTRRGALAIGGAVLALALLARMVADTAAGAGWLRALTPLGWAEDLRPFADPRPLFLVPLAALTAVLLLGSRRLALGRDVGTGLLPARDSAPLRPRGLGGPAALALRGQRATLLTWAGGVGAMALLLGVLSTSATQGISGDLDRQIRKLGASLTSVDGFFGIEFLFLVLALSLFACGQVAQARAEEADGRLETLLAQPLGRARWVAGRLALGVAAATALAGLAGGLAWAGATAAGAAIGLGDLLGAGLNALPATLVFGGLGALLVALVPRAGVPLAFGLVGLAFLWDAVGSVAGLPGWALGLSPFHHVALVPAEPFAAGSAAVMVAVALAAAALAVWRFGRRDLVSG